MECSECGDFIEGQHVTKTRKIFCSPCWSHNVETKTRKRIFEATPNSPGAKEAILLYYDGSPAAVALVNLMLACGTNHNASMSQRPFPFTFAILAILEGDDIPGAFSLAKQQKHLQNLISWASLNSFEVFATCAESALSPGELNLEPAETFVPNPPNFSGLCDIMAAIPSKTAQRDLTSILRLRAALFSAKVLKIWKIFLPFDQTTMASQMFTLMSLGRGAQVAGQMNFKEDWGGIELFRPLLDFSCEDLRVYLDALPSEMVEGLYHKEGNKKGTSSGGGNKIFDSLEGQCGDFISNLQRGYPSTVSTLTRIGGKLMDMGNVKGEQTCGLCLRTLRDSDLESGSRWCYGCGKILKEMNDSSILESALLQ